MKKKENSSKWKTKEIWQVSGMYDPGLDPKLGKKSF